MAKKTARKRKEQTWWTIKKEDGQYWTNSFGQPDLTKYKCRLGLARPLGERAVRVKLVEV